MSHSIQFRSPLKEQSSAEDQSYTLVLITIYHAPNLDHSKVTSLIKMQ